jgi:hypothetical protein
MRLVLVIAALLAGCACPDPYVQSWLDGADASDELGSAIAARPEVQTGMDDLWGPDLDYSSLAK